MKNLNLTIQDNQELLCKFDRYQVERMVWLRLAPVMSSIRSVNFQIHEVVNGKKKIDCVVKILTELTGGSIVRVEAVCDAQMDTILTATEMMEDQVRKQVNVESMKVFALMQGTANLCRKMLAKPWGELSSRLNPIQNRFRGWLETQGNGDQANSPIESKVST
jgi:hypothetical protein